MTLMEIRERYLKFFSDRGHAILVSSSLVPENDPTTLFTGSGMQPMVPYLLGAAHPRGVRITDAQRCFRSQDIDEVGDNRHTTFFEMLGNWSLGDYFKKEQIGWMFEFLTKELSLDPNRLYVTVFRGNDLIARDEEAVAIWKEQFLSVGIDACEIDFAENNGMQNGRIFYYDEKKNWWSRSGVPSRMPVGEPGGPDSEMFWDFGESLQLHEQSDWKNDPCHVNCDCGRFAEIGNNVFMQYQKTENGFVELSQKNVDFGGGLERLAFAVKDNPDMFSIDVFQTAISWLESHSGKKYVWNSKEAYPFRVIVDHLRAATFLIGDGVFPSNKDQGYFVRRLIRRSVRFANQLGIQEEVCSAIGSCFIDVYRDAYPLLEQERATVLDQLAKEERKFKMTLQQGVKKFEELVKSSGADPSSVTKMISGMDAFDLLQSFGFPIELTQELALERGMTVDFETFKVEKEKHQALSRAGSEQKFKGGLADHSEMSVKYHTATHLLHAALRKILGETIVQKGSNITPERMRFDFPFQTKLTDEQLKQTEDLVNGAIHKKLPVTFEMLTLDEAKKRDAIGLFADKYAEVGDKVKVYFVGDVSTGTLFSSEVCGCPHVL
ncbi:MAG: alanine--tRNA ligase, partial [Patescibacteria group bacterium]